MAVVIVECSDGDVVVVDRDIASRWSAAIRAKLGTPPWPIFAPLSVASVRAGTLSVGLAPWRSTRRRPCAARPLGSDTLHPEGLPDGATVVLDNITGRALHKVMEYCLAHAGGNKAELKAWDDKFVRLDPGTLCELASVRSLRPPSCALTPGLGRVPPGNQAARRPHMSGHRTAAQGCVSLTCAHPLTRAP